MAGEYQLETSTVEITGHSGTTAYTANSRVGPASGSAPAKLANCAIANGRGGVITMIRVSTNKKSITPRFRLHFFNAVDPTLSADNLSWQEKYADGSKRVGYVDIDALATGADTTNSDCSRAQNVEVRLPFKCAADSRDLWVAIEPLDAFTPQTNQLYSIVVKVEQN